MKNPFKKKLVVKTESTTGTIKGEGKVGPVEVPKPKLKAACGFEYGGNIYKTAKEANDAYQQYKVRDFMSHINSKNGFYDAGYSHAASIMIANWGALTDIMNDKLEME